MRKDELLLLHKIYREDCPEFSDIRVVPVEDGEAWGQDPSVAALAANGFVVIDVGSQSADTDGRVRAYVILGRKAQS